jgi:sporulation protein YlmC with PRC-barrel domain
MEKVTQLLFCEVVSENGERLGRVFDIRCYGEPEHGIANQERTVRELLYGTRGLLELIGLRKTSFQSVAWESVRGIEDGKIIVDENYQTVKTTASDDERAIEKGDARRAETEATSGS